VPDEHPRAVAQQGMAVTSEGQSQQHPVSAESEELLRLMIAGVRDFAVFATDAEGRILSWNPGVGYLLGYEESEWVGLHGSVIFTPEDRERGADVEEMETAAREGRALDERWHVRRDGTRFWSSGLLMALRDGEGRLRGYAKMLRDATKPRQTEEKLRDANGRLVAAAVREQAARAEAEEANRLKDEFLATLSHELRTPLTAILGWAHLLRSGRLDEQGAARAVETIERNADAQKQLIEDILDVSRIVTGKFALEAGPVEPAAVVEAAAEAVRPAADARRIELNILMSPRTGVVSGDAARLRQVVWNLLTNAVKFTPEGGRVEARVERADPYVRIEVSDTGEGIDPEFLPYVFDRFRQADATTTRKRGGLGLGLSIVRQLVELHGGTVSAESEGRGQGATFTVTLPLAGAGTQSGEPEGPRAAREERTAAPEEDCPPSLAGLRVLVVDDEPDTLDFLVAVLEGCGADVTIASSAAEAFRLLHEAKPDVLVSDIGMPGEDGYALIRKVRRLEEAEGGRTPAVALTAYAREADRRKAVRAGFHAHMTKPVVPSELAEVIASLAGRAGRA
jgi:PAS domain S-box-containing protein